MKFKESKYRENQSLSDYLKGNKNSKEWAGWTEYAKKSGARLTFIQNSNRLEPLTEGEDDLNLNPGLFLGKGSSVNTINCALKLSRDNVTFAHLYEKAHNVLTNSTRLDKQALAVELISNFHNLVFMEIQYLGGCDIQWKNNDSVGGSARSGAVGGSQSSSDTDVLSLLQNKGGLNQEQREDMLLHAALENSKKDTSSSSAEKSVQDAAAATADGGGSNNDGGKGGGGGDGDGESGNDIEGEGGES